MATSAPPPFAVSVSFAGGAVIVPCPASCTGASLSALVADALRAPLERRLGGGAVSPVDLQLWRVSAPDARRLRGGDAFDARSATLLDAEDVVGPDTWGTDDRIWVVIRPDGAWGGRGLVPRERAASARRPDSRHPCRPSRPSPVCSAPERGSAVGRNDGCV